MSCSGSATGVSMPYSVLPVNGVSVGDSPAATIQDRTPQVNIRSFGTCKMQGAPVPCAPAFSSPFVGGTPGIQIGSAPALNDGAWVVCGRGGIVVFHSPGQFTIEIP